MKAIRLSFVLLLAIAGAACRSRVAANQRLVAADVQSSAAAAANGARSKPVMRDDLEWLVGRWLCVDRQFLTQQELLMAGSDNLLEYFNVYLPYSDDHLTLNLTDDPDDRPIAAEFLVRHVDTFGAFREQLIPMFEGGPVSIGKGRIWYGSRPRSSDFDFSYHVEKLQHGTLWLTLESRAMRFGLIKLLCDVGDLRNSSVSAPIKDYSPSQILDLQRRYEELKRLSEEKPPLQAPTTGSKDTRN